MAIVAYRHLYEAIAIKTCIIYQKIEKYIPNQDHPSIPSSYLLILFQEIQLFPSYNERSSLVLDFTLISKHLQNVISWISHCRLRYLHV